MCAGFAGWMMALASQPSPPVLIELTGLGVLEANLVNGSVIEALNIPFAQPPLGMLRFRPAQQPPPAWGGIRDGTRYGPGCVQTKTSYPTDEDCLSLNVWRPMFGVANATMLPVFIWAFGGGLTAGSGRTFNGSRLAQLAGAVVVTLNYRVGALGFYASEELKAEDPSRPATGSLNGVHDILAALRFVQRHAADFGADPQRITLGGESSGAVSSCILAFSPLARGAFSRLVIESGACTGPWFGSAWTRARSLAASADFLNTTGAHSLAELRALPTAALLRSSKWATLDFGLDGYVLPGDARPADAPLLFDGPVVLGGNTNDTTCLSSKKPAAPHNLTALRAALATYFTPDDVDDVLAPYLRREGAATGAAPDARRLWFSMSRDAGVSCPTLWLARRLAATPARPTYVYSFGFNAKAPADGAAHGGETGFVFLNDQPTPLATAVARGVASRWAAFVRGEASADAWPPLGGNDTEAPYLDVGAGGAISAAESFYHEACEPWSAYAARGPVERERFDAFGYLC